MVRATTACDFCTELTQSTPVLRADVAQNIQAFLGFAVYDVRLAEHTQYIDERSAHDGVRVLILRAEHIHWRRWNAPCLDKLYVYRRPT